MFWKRASPVQGPSVPNLPVNNRSTFKAKRITVKDREEADKRFQWALNQIRRHKTAYQMLTTTAMFRAQWNINKNATRVLTDLLKLEELVKAQRSSWEKSLSRWPISPLRQGNRKAPSGLVSVPTKNTTKSVVFAPSILKYFDSLHQLFNMLVLQLAKVPNKNIPPNKNWVSQHINWQKKAWPQSRKSLKKK